MKFTNLLTGILLLASAGNLTAGAGSTTNWIRVPVSLASGTLSNTGAEPVSHLIGQLSRAEATHLRVVMAEAHLGTGSLLKFVSSADGQTQTLNAAQLQMWQDTSAIFNGASVRVEVIVAPGDTGVSVEVKELMVDSGEAGNDDCCPRRRTRTLCGPDNRVASTDNRAGRIRGGCTGWLVSNGAVLTAGHCGIVAGSVLEVNVPASAANGTAVASAVQDQFPVLAGSITTSNAGGGDDWTVCRVGPNNLGQSAHLLHGFFRMTKELPAGGQTMRITGCGIDNSPLGSAPDVCGSYSDGVCTHFGLNAQNKTLQTSTGGFGSESGTSLTYSVDTEPANSGSPVIWESNGFTIGIHTNGGCSSGGGANSGTSFELDTLENAVAGVPGGNFRYLDLVKAPGGTENGSVFQPHDTLTEAVNATPVNGGLAIVTGNYTGSANRMILSKPMTMTAPVGAVTFGQ